MTFVRTAIAFAVLTFAAVTAASAAEYASREVLGFAPDGSAFAFEEYGVQDGSGFPYSNIYIVRTASDSWAPGTPIRVRIDTDGTPLVQARQQAHAQAQAKLAEYQIGAQGVTLVMNPVNELSADPHNVVFRRNRFDQEVRQLSIAEVELPAPSCPDWGEAYKGMQLTLTGPGGSTMLNNDTSIPKSRGCALGYGISEVIYYQVPGSGDGVGIALINVFGLGFEGQDRRFIAVAFQL